jgi:hypothetical protein
MSPGMGGGVLEKCKVRVRAEIQTTRQTDGRRTLNSLPSGTYLGIHITGHDCRSCLYGKREPRTISLVAREPLHQRCMSEGKCARGLGHYDDEDQRDILVFKWFTKM